MFDKTPDNYALKFLALIFMGFCNKYDKTNSQKHQGKDIEKVNRKHRE